MKETAVKCTKNVLALLKTHFLQLVVERVGVGVSMDFNPDSLLELAE